MKEMGNLLDEVLKEHQQEDEVLNSVSTLNYTLEVDMDLVCTIQQFDNNEG